MEVHEIPLNETSQMPYKGVEEEVCSCLLIRLEPIQLLVPRTLIAEVIQLNATTLQPSTHQDIDILEWRGAQIPVLKPHLINPFCLGETNEDSKVLIFHGLSNFHKLPFFGLPASRNPRLTQVLASSIINDEHVQTVNPGELQAVQLNGEAAVIPKVDFLERFILDNFSFR